MVDMLWTAELDMHVWRDRESPTKATRRTPTMLACNRNTLPRIDANCCLDALPANVTFCAQNTLMDTVNG